MKFPSIILGLCCVVRVFTIYSSVQSHQYDKVTDRRIDNIEASLEDRILKRLEANIESRLEAKIEKRLEAKFEAKYGGLQSALNSMQHQRSKRLVLDQPETRPVAFSARLDHPLYHLGPDQTVIFNDALLNDGNAYNPINGYFTTPFNGVYLFSFFVGEYGTEEVLVKLTVNNSINEADAIAEGIQGTHNDQGGNLVILKLAKGKMVRVATYHNSDSYIDTNKDIYFSTFSGALLYETD